MTIRILCAMAAALAVGACSAPVPRDAGRGHLTTETTRPAPGGDIPAPVQQTLNLPKPRNLPRAETYSVVVNNVAVRDLLFALARDAKLNVDIHPGISGNVTLNAIDQTLQQLLTRIAKQVDMRFELDGPNLAVLPDTPYLKHYKVDYVNLSRSVTGTVSTNTQIATGLPGSDNNTSSNTGGNVSSTRIENTSKNHFWESLDKNIKDILRETDKILPEGSSETVVEEATNQNASGLAALPQVAGRAAANVANALAGGPTPTSTAQSTGNTIVRRSTFREAASVIINAESGTVTVRATGRQHERIQEFLDRVIGASRRQVMIEATIVEVTLGDGYEQGIDWTKLIGGGQFQLKNTLSGSQNLIFTGTNISTATISLLETFGTAKVLSSPRVSVLNNQTALLKAVQNVVYFNVKAEIAPGNVNTNAVTAYTTTPQTVSVGLVLTVTPQISDNDTVILNVRPTVTSLGTPVRDPNPSLLIPNEVPQIQTREIESVMRVNSGDTAVLGGLMRDSVDYSTARIPVLGQIPLIGELATNRNNTARKSELVIFLRPIVIKDASLQGDYAGLRDSLPGKQFFTPPREANPLSVPTGQ